MIARWHGETVRIIAIVGDKAKIAWRRGLRWVKVADLEALIDETLIAGLVASLALLAWLVLR